MDSTHKIRKFILDNILSIDNDVILNDEDNIFELGFVDSMFAMELVSFVEGELGTILDDEDLVLANFSSVKAIVDLLARKAN